MKRGRKTLLELLKLSVNTFAFSRECRVGPLREYPQPAISRGHGIDGCAFLHRCRRERCAQRVPCGTAQKVSRKREGRWQKAVPSELRGRFSFLPFSDDQSQRWTSIAAGDDVGSGARSECWLTRVAFFQFREVPCHPGHLQRGEEGTGGRRRVWCPSSRFLKSEKVWAPRASGWQSRGFAAT